MLFLQLRYFEIAQDIYYVYKTNPNLSYFELSYVFWEHNDSVGRGTIVFLKRLDIKKCLNWLQRGHCTAASTSNRLGEVLR